MIDTKFILNVIFTVLPYAPFFIAENHRFLLFKILIQIYVKNMKTKKNEHTTKYLFTKLATQSTVLKLDTCSKVENI